MKRKKIFHVEVNGKTNTGEYVNKIIKATTSQCKDEIVVKVFTSNDSLYSTEFAIPVFKKYGLVKNPLLKMYYYIVGFSTIFLKIIREDAKTIIHFHWLRLSLFDLLYFLLLRAMTKAKIVFTVHNVLPHEVNTIDKTLYPFIYKQVHYFTFHSNSAKEKIESLFKSNIKNYDIIPHYGYQVGISSTQCINNSILFFGTIRDYKGLDILLQACTYINSDNNWTLNIFGKPEMNLDALYKYAASTGLDKKILWNIGWIDSDKIDEIFNKHEIVVLPYKRIDNSGLIHLAMSYGKPVIASNLGSLSDIITDEENGLLFKPFDAEDLASKIKLLLKSKELRHTLGYNAKKVMQEDHSLSRIGKLHCNLYLSL